MMMANQASHAVSSTTLPAGESASATVSTTGTAMLPTMAPRMSFGYSRVNRS